MRDNSKKENIKKDYADKKEPRRSSFSKDAPKKDYADKKEPRRSSFSKDTPKKDYADKKEPRRSSFSKDAPKKDSVDKKEPRRSSFSKDAPKKDSSSRTDSRRPSTSRDGGKRDFSRSDSRRPSTSRDSGKRDFNTKPRYREENDENEDKELLGQLVYGKNPVLELLNSDTDVNKVWILENVKSLDKVYSAVKEKNIPFQIVNKARLEALVGSDANTQGVIAARASKDYTEFDELVKLANEKRVTFVVLDKVEDPHNLGAIIRSADAAGVDAIIIPKHRAVGLTGVVAKTSAGALERMKISRVTNLTKAVEELKENNVWIVGVDMDGTEIYSQANVKGSVAIVVGGEGHGLSKVLKDKCDFTIKIPMQSAANSLNVSVATALIIYEVYRQNNFK